MTKTKEVKVREDSTLEYCVKCRIAFAYGSLAWGLHKMAGCPNELVEFIPKSHKLLKALK